MRRHVLGLLLATVLCWNLCQGDIEFYSDDDVCSKNGTTKTVSIQKAVSVIFCVTLGPQDELYRGVRIRSSNQSYQEGTLYRLNNTDSRQQVTSLTKSSYTTINITFTKLETGDFKEKFFVSIYQIIESHVSYTAYKEKVLVWFVLEQETESANETRTSETSDHGDTTSSISATDSETPGCVNRFLDIGVTAVIVLILCTTTGSLIYCCRIRSFKRSRQAVSVNIQEELPRQNNVPLLPTVTNIPGQSTGSGHGNKSRDQSTCPVELSSPYTQYEEIRNDETGSRESSSVPASRAFSDIQREQVEYEIPVQEKPRDGTPYCYMELMDDPSGVSAASVSSAGKGKSQFSKVVEYENTLPVL